ncbi:hypothetical protein TEU_07630 [Thermococcus eurythermalis]|uniref:Uncharacterized protein n=1 Tax=Thermococcus eurythermalis TaxID=1505907 RepID=A0A097QUQ8_9EURY|nr:hypothetical protein [Thermococcus eurythermalis]AIU70211.1 hypothetical protein TEU_07630 [Thermococcus eurythermalis]
MAVSVRNSEGVKLLIEEVAKAVGVSPRELIEYYEWKANLEKLKKARTKKMTKEEARKIIEEWGKKEPLMSEEDAIKLYYEAREEIKKWEQIERRLKKLGLE